MGELKPSRKTDAFDLWRVQRVDLLAALPLTLVANLIGQRQRQGEGVTERRVSAILRLTSRITRPSKVLILRKALFARLNCLDGRSAGA
jgi:hypothetical protein